MLLMAGATAIYLPIDRSGCMDTMLTAFKGAAGSSSLCVERVVREESPLLRLRG
jgi:hypothetical protein